MLACDCVCVCTGDLRPACKSLGRMSVPVLVGYRQERDQQSDARRLRATYGEHGVDDVPARLRGRRA